MVESYLGNNRYFYQSNNFKENVAVTGHLLKPGCDSFCPSFDFTEIGNGIYYADLEHENVEGFKNTDKYGLLIKEDGITVKFEIIYVGNSDR
jgi:hypothetical protein